MAMIIIMGRYYPSLLAIKDSLPDDMMADCLCIDAKNLKKPSRAFAQHENPPAVAIFDVSSIVDGLNKELDAFVNAYGAKVQKIAIHDYGGGILKSLQTSFKELEFIHLNQVACQLPHCLKNIGSSLLSSSK